MESFKPESMRNVVFVAHGGAGKSTLIESLLYFAHEISTPGSSVDGTTTMTTEPEEAVHHIAITPHVGHFTWNGCEVHLVDSPGYFNFLESTRGVIPGIDGAVLVLSGVEGAKHETRRLWSMLAEAKVPTIAFVTRIDDEASDYMHAIDSARSATRASFQPLTIPIRSGKRTPGIIDLLNEIAWIREGDKMEKSAVPGAMRGDVAALRTQLIERIVEGDDKLLESYLAGEALSIPVLQAGLKRAVSECRFIPVLCGSGAFGIGIEPLIESIIYFLPSPSDRDSSRPFCGDNSSDPAQIIRKCSLDQPFSAIVLKTSVDQFSGKLSIVRVVSGEIRSNQTIINTTNGEKQRAGHIYLVQGKKLTSVDKLRAGEIGAIGKLEETHTGDTLSDVNQVISYPKVHFAAAPVSYAVEVEGKSEDKVALGLARLADEDPTLHLHRDQESHEIIISGMGQTHIELALERLSRKFGGKAKLKVPRVPYRETITKKVKVQGKLKKQSGGHGQFANTWIEVEPLPRDGGFIFEDRITGGVIPKQYMPSVRKGVLAATVKGVLAGYPVVDIKVALIDGSFHSVDSSDMAFQIAGSLGLKEALEQAHSILLEPLMIMDIIIPEECVGAVLKDLSSRRGRVISMESQAENQEIEAEVPMSEVLEYGNVLGGLTSGRGVFSMSISTYRELPQHLYDQVLGQKQVGNG